MFRSLGLKVERLDPLEETIPADYKHSPYLDEYDDQRWPGAKIAIDEFFADKPEKPIPHRKCHWKYFVQKTAEAP